MARFYTEKEMNAALRERRIKPVNGKVTTKEAADILTWRAKEEFNVDHPYPESAVRRRTQKKHIQPAPGSNLRQNLYKVEDVFALPLYPNRGAKPDRSNNQSTQNSESASPSEEQSAI